MSRRFSQFFRLTFVFCASALISVGALSAQAAEKYRRAMLFEGGGFQTAMFLGMLEGAESMNMTPDVIVGTCGGSLAGAVVNAFPTSEERRRFIESKEFYELLLSLELTEERSLGNALNLIKEMRRYRRNEVLPDIFRRYIMDIPRTLPLAALDKPFTDSFPRVVMLAAELNFGPEDALTPHENRKDIQQVFITDPQTAELLQGLPSPIHAFEPNSALKPETKVYTNINALPAARAGISDPYYMPPAKIGDHYYLTGAVDLYPLEVGKALADEVIANFVAPFDTVVEQRAAASTFRYDNNKRLRAVHDMEADYWIDVTDTPSVYSKFGFNPGFSLKTFKIEKNIPATHEEYVKRVQGLWAYGKERAIEALMKTTKNDKTHVRELTPTNASWKLLDTRKVELQTP